MKKTILIFILIFTLASISASPIFQFGGNISLADITIPNNEDEGKIISPEIGLEARLNILFMQLGSRITAGFPFQALGVPYGVALNFDPFFNFRLDWKIIALEAGVGANFDSLYLIEDKAWYQNGITSTSLSNYFKNGNLNYNVGIEVIISKVTLAFSFSLPTNGTFNNFSLLPNWNGKKFSFSILGNFG